MRHVLAAVLFGLVLTTVALPGPLNDAGIPVQDLHVEEAHLAMAPPVRVRSAGTLPGPAALLEGQVSTQKRPAAADASRRSTVSQSFDSGAADFALKVRDEVIPYRIFGLFVMPDEEVELEAVFTDGIGSGELMTDSGTVDRTGPETWNWTAPSEPGLYSIAVSDGTSGDEIRLNVFVMRPFAHDTVSLNGYRIGRYESKPLRGSRAYVRPDGFVEVTPQNRDTLVSPHFTLGQFLCKQQQDHWPKYVLVQERLLLKLEMMLEQVNEMGYPANTLRVMSGFRTPWYNRSIGNRTKYSQHLYGSAADVYVDLNDDDWMDDLTGDDEVTRRDAVRMANIIESQKNEAWYRPFIGGLGVYGPASHRGPFIHVDVRGTFARW